jgi:glycosyltransferase involved in cell wall biosynthesis
MKILFLTDNFPPEINAPASRTYDHVREWHKAGHEVTVITCAPNFPKGRVYEGYKNKLYQTEWMDGIKVVRVWSYIAANKGFLKRTLDYISYSVTSFLAGLFQKTDIIIATSPQFFTALSGRTLAFWKRKPWIMEVRDLWPESIKTVGAMSDNVFIRYFEWEEMRCYRSARKIVVVTDSFKRTLTARGVPAEKIEVVKNGANRELFKPMPKDEALAERLGLKGKRVIGYIGTHGLAHKLDFILQCAKNMQGKNDYHFLFIGAGAEKERLLKMRNTHTYKGIRSPKLREEHRFCRHHDEYMESSDDMAVQAPPCASAAHKLRHRPRAALLCPFWCYRNTPPQAPLSLHLQPKG